MAVVNLDIIAKRRGSDGIEILTPPKYSWLAEVIHHLARLYCFAENKVTKKDC